MSPRNRVVVGLCSLVVAAFAAGPAHSAPAILLDLQVSGQQVTLKLTRPIGYRANRNGASVIVTMDDTDVSLEAREKSGVSMVVAGIQALPAKADGSEPARVVVKLDRPREFSTEMAGNDLLVKIKEPAAPEKRAAKTPAAKAPPAAPPAAETPPAAPAEGEAPAPAPWRLKGRLADKDGKPLDGPFAVAFRLKDSASKDVWSEWLKVKSAKGAFSATLGLTNPLPDSLEGVKLTADFDAGAVTIPPFRIQLASLPTEAKAKKFEAEVEAKLGAADVREVEVGGKKVYRVLAGPLDRASAQALLEKAKGLGHQGILVQD